MNHPAFFHHRGAPPLSVLNGLDHPHQRDVAARGGAAERAERVSLPVNTVQQLNLAVMRPNLHIFTTVRAPDGLDGLLVRPLSVQQGRVHVKHPLIWGGRFLQVIQASAAIQVTTVHLHSVHGGVRVWAGTGGLYNDEK